MRMFRGVIIALTIILIIRIFIIDIYLVPTPSMEPTIMSEDFILTVKPFILQQKKPKIDETWVFIKHYESNDSKLFFVKRLYGSPGDTICIFNGSLITNSKPNNKTKLPTSNISIGSLNYPNLKIFPNDTSLVKWTALNFGPLWIPKKGSTIELNELNILLYNRYILHESPHLFLKKNGEIANKHKVLTEYTFTKNYYFACGDNLIFSSDSRHWGLVPEDNFICKARFILFSKNNFFLNLNRVFKPIK